MDRSYKNDSKTWRKFQIVSKTNISLSSKKTSIHFAINKWMSFRTARIQNMSLKHRKFKARLSQSQVNKMMRTVVKHCLLLSMTKLKLTTTMKKMTI